MIGGRPGARKEDLVVITLPWVVSVHHKVIKANGSEEHPVL